MALTEQQHAPILFLSRDSSKVVAYQVVETSVRCFPWVAVDLGDTLRQLST